MTKQLKRAIATDSRKHMAYRYRLLKYLVLGCRYGGFITVDTVVWVN